MGQVIPFIARARDGADWSADERARLEELADRLADAGVGVEVVFGVSDGGDPWCVVKGEDEEILIHVARIDGIFVVHSALDHSLTEGRDLQALLRERMDAGLEAEAQPDGVVVPFDLKRAQTFLALAVAVGFLYETAGPAPAQAAELLRLAEADEPAPPPPVDLAHNDRDLTVQTAAVAEVAPDAPPRVLAAAAASVPDAAPAPLIAGIQPAPAPPEAPATAADPVTAEPAPVAEGVVREIVGTEGDDLLVGSAQAEVLLGGAGDDTLEGGGGADLLNGGSGDDRIEFTDGALVVGGAGADTFVVQAATHLSGVPTLLGVLFDFNADDGDRIVTARGEAVSVLPGPGAGAGAGVSNGFGPANLPTPPPAAATPGAIPYGTFDWNGTTFTMVRRDIDLDGDGMVDGFLLFSTPTDHGGGRMPPGPNIVGADPLDPGRWFLDNSGDGVIDADLVVRRQTDDGLWELATVPHGWQPPEFGA